MKMPNDSNIGSSADKPIELDLDSMDIDIAMTDLFGDNVDNSSTEATNTADGLFSPVVGDAVLTSDFPGKSEKMEGSILDALSQPSNDIYTTLGRSDHPQQASQPAPSPGSLFASLSPSSQLMANAPASNGTNGEPQFDLNSLDLSLSPVFFANDPSSDMNFPMDMNDFLNLGGSHEQAEGIKLEST